MIEQISISNFKSVVNLTLDLGRFNILIGENGCGKSNILEAIAFGAAAGADKLDYEFLGSRGIRLTEPKFIKSAFDLTAEQTPVSFSYLSNGKNYPFAINNDVAEPHRWKRLRDKSEIVFPKIAGEFFTKSVQYINSSEEEKNELLKVLINELIENLNSTYLMSDFLLYSLEQSSLRKFADSNQIYPLGIHGEGLFRYLKNIAADPNKQDMLAAIAETMALLDWFTLLKMPDNMLKNENVLNVGDRYLRPELEFFDQNSTNEGFLYLLFFATLFISDITPRFFAIDNIDTAFNPKLCREIIRTLNKLAVKHDKQVMATTHNPAVLDGLDLSDDNQRLFVVRRDEDGHTVVKRITHNPDRKKPLSEIWTSGYIGGLPENF